MIGKVNPHISTDIKQENANFLKTFISSLNKGHYVEVDSLADFTALFSSGIIIIIGIVIVNVLILPISEYDL